MTEREKIAARIRALLAKTVANGCTEDEAIAAAQKAAELLARYNLDVDEVELRASPFGRQQQSHADEVGERLWKPASAIAKLTGAAFWISAAGVHPVEINFFGFEHEVEVASYLLTICARAMRTEKFKLETGLALLSVTVRRRRIVAFLDGMADRLRQRILALIIPAPSGTGLVVLRGDLVLSAMKNAGISLQERQARPSRDLDPSYADGHRAADRVALNPGLAPAKPTQGFLR